MRVGEVVRLDHDDIELAAGLLTIRDSKFGNYAEVAIMPSWCRMLLLGAGNAATCSA